MVVLAASVLAKSGKTLVSRQYMEMSRVRIEGLLAAFPKLMGGNRQHTYVETEAVRYLYQPMEGLYLVLVTNKQSNILEDLETLRLLSKLVPEFSGSLEEEAICAHAFDLIFAFDEVISLGHKETITIMQVKQNCEMESHEEKLHKMIIQTKINDTKDVMKKKVQEMEKSRMESKKMAGSMGIPSSIAGFGKSAGFGADSMGGGGPGGVGGGGMGSDLGSSRAEPAPTRSAAPMGKGPAKGMQLGKAKKNNAFLENLAKEGEVVELDAPSTSQGGARPGAPATVMANLSADPVTLNIEEKLAVQLNKQGGLENLEVQGTLSLLVQSEPDAYLSVVVTSPASKAFQFKTHPNIDKAAYSSKGLLALKDPSRPFPTGSELGILKWRMQSKDEGLVPITINCWPSVSGGQSFVNIEYESTASFDLQHVTIAIPLPNGPPTVNQCDGEWRFDSRNSVLVWTIDLVDDSNRSGSMEFAVGAVDADAFYPIEVAFTSDRTFCDLTIESVVNTQRDGAAAKYASRRVLSTSEYIVA